MATVSSVRACMIGSCRDMQSVQILNCYISQTSVATCLRCDAISNDSFIANFLENLAIKGFFFKSDNIFGKNKVNIMLYPFFDPTRIFDNFCCHSSDVNITNLPMIEQKFQRVRQTTEAMPSDQFARLLTRDRSSRSIINSRWSCEVKSFQFNFV